MRSWWQGKFLPAVIDNTGMLLILIQMRIIYLPHSVFIIQSKVIRVLNLWQKNQVFAPEVVQPLFDLADPNHSIHKDPAIAAIAAAAAAAATTSNGLASTPTKGTSKCFPCGFYFNFKSL